MNSLARVLSLALPSPPHLQGFFSRLFQNSFLLLAPLSLWFGLLYGLLVGYLCIGFSHLLSA
jgi:hypothetical protein